MKQLRKIETIEEFDKPFETNEELDSEMAFDNALCMVYVTFIWLMFQIFH